LEETIVWHERSNDRSLAASPNNTDAARPRAAGDDFTRRSPRRVAGEGRRSI
jgi:hypothetical protein